MLAATCASTSSPAFDRASASDQLTAASAPLSCGEDELIAASKAAKLEQSSKQTSSAAQVSCADSLSIADAVSAFRILGYTECLIGEADLLDVLHSEIESSDKSSISRKEYAAFLRLFGEEDAALNYS